MTSFSKKSRPSIIVVLRKLELLVVKLKGKCGFTDKHADAMLHVQHEGGTSAP